MDRRNDVDNGSVEPYFLPSRRAAFDACRAAIDAQEGPVLLTGEAGVGKTWLARCLARSWRADWVLIDLTPSATPADFLRAIAHGLSVPASGAPGFLRLAVADALAQDDADGHHWGLIVDEAHLAASEILEEIRVLSNHLGRPDGFAALVLLGQTGLARRVATRPLAGLETRLAECVHLRPIDADEAHDLLKHVRPERAHDLAQVERWHRDAAGNPRRLLRLATAPGVQDVAPGPIEPRRDGPITAPFTVPRLGPAKPPIHVEDGLIEVGWNDEAEGETPSPSEASPAPPAAVAVDDHYAALQAWNEWASNQGRRSALAPKPHDSTALDDPDPLAPAEPTGHPNVWAEDGQPFAPYSQLFSRTRQPKDTD